MAIDKIIEINPNMKSQTRIFIIGMPGSGKTTWGKRLANKLGFNFIDLDKEIENYFGQTTDVIFEKFGEERFRETEKSILHNTLKYNNTIISCGGGAPCFFDNINWMNKHGLTVYFCASSSLIFDRVSQNYNHRPLLKGLKPADLKNKLAEMLTQREAFYTKAQLQIKVPLKSLQALIQIVSSRISI